MKRLPKFDKPDPEAVPVEVRSNTTIENMELYRMAKWVAIIDAVNVIADKAEQKGINFDDLILKPLAIEKYVESTSDIVYRQLLTEAGQERVLENLGFIEPVV